MTYAKGKGLEGPEGPNDARHVVWALGEPFFSFSLYYLILIDFLLYLYVTSTIYAKKRGLEGWERQNGPKQCQTRRLDPR